MPRVPLLRFVYKIFNCDNKILNGIAVDFRADTREEADVRAHEEASKFGPNAYAKFKKEI